MQLHYAGGGDISDEIVALLCGQYTESKCEAHKETHKGIVYIDGVYLVIPRGDGPGYCPFAAHEIPAVLLYLQSKAGE